MSRYDRPSHRVFMTFFLRSGWQVQFLEADLITPLPRKFTFTRSPIPTKSGSWPSEARLGVTQRAGRCLSMQLRTAEVGFT